MINISIVCESVFDFNVAGTLIDRKLVDKIDWLEEKLLEYHRSYNGLKGDSQFIAWKSIKGLAQWTKLWFE